MASLSKKLVNAISDVIENRPRPIRGVDQIYMKAGDLAAQARYVGERFANKKLIFIGDGDGVGLAVMHLSNLGLITSAPSKVLHLDFDERIVKGVTRFADHYRFSDRMEAMLYNVADPLPQAIQRQYDAFYTNPPYGASNDGESVLAFVERGIQATRDKGAKGAIVIAHDDGLPWTTRVLKRVQDAALDHGFLIEAMEVGKHEYHLDDAPTLKSCNLIIARKGNRDASRYESAPLKRDRYNNFYGADAHLTIRYIKEPPNFNYGRAAEGSYEIEYL